MPGMTHRLYPKELGPENVTNIRNIMCSVLTTRYQIARDWLSQHFQGRRVKIIDIACGSGYGTEILSELGEVVGVDIDPEVIEYACENYRSKCRYFLTGSADDSAFLETLGTFDAIVSLATVEHVDDEYAFLRWMTKALRPGGVVVVCFPSVVTMDWAIPYHKRDITRSGARRLFKKHGFKIIKDCYQNNKLDPRHLLNEIRTLDNEIPVPGWKHWMSYYLLHPHHAILRAYELTIGRGVHFGDQQYLLCPECDDHLK